MNKDFLASTSVFAEMANNDVDLQRIVSEFIINTYILNDTYSQNTNEIRSELIKLFDIDVPEAIVRSQLKRLKKDQVVDQVNGQFIINPEHRSSRQYINLDVKEKLDLQLEIFEKLLSYVSFHKGPLSDDQRAKLESNFIEYLFDNSIEDEYSTLISAFIVKNEDETRFLKELNLIREGTTILKGIYYSADFNDTNVWRNKLTIFLDTEHLLSLTGLNGETFEQMLMDFYNLVREINLKTKSKDGKLIQLKYTQNVKKEIENLFYVAKLIVKGKASLQPGKTAIKNIVEGCSQNSDITRKVSEFYASLKNMGVYEAEQIDLFENPEYNIVDEKALVKYASEKDEEEINKILEEFTFINILRKGRNNRRFENINYVMMTGDRVTRSMSYDSDLKLEDSDFSFATDVYYITQRFWFKLNKGLGFNAILPSTLDVVNKARVIISSQINSSVRKRFDNLESEINSGARTPGELEEYYLRLRANTFSPESITAEFLEDQISFIFDDDDLENYLRNRSAEKSALKARTEKVTILEQESLEKDKTTAKIKESLLKTSELSANKLYKFFRIVTQVALGLMVVFVAIIGYILKQETDSILSVIAYIISGVSLISGLFNWKKIDSILKKRAFIDHYNLLKVQNESRD